MISEYISPNENFKYGYPHSNAPLQFELEMEHCKQHKAGRHPTKCDVINDVQLFPTVYRRIVTHFLCYPIRHHVTNSSAWES